MRAATTDASQPDGEKLAGNFDKQTGPVLRVARFVPDGSVIGRNIQRHRHQDFLALQSANMFQNLNLLDCARVCCVAGA
ncbi:hypothetical protein AB4Z52_26730 [Rhizobium sp. 2YAF20]|uniref:hypothetical protein n=1 Tax=Rhizobium sp. 2YAF20 TaxID=3233027 RepID=UPI003F95B605